MKRKTATKKPLVRSDGAVLMSSLMPRMVSMKRSPSVLGKHDFLTGTFVAPNGVRFTVGMSAAPSSKSKPGESRQALRDSAWGFWKAGLLKKGKA